MMGAMIHPMPSSPPPLRVCLKEEVSIAWRKYKACAQHCVAVLTLRLSWHGLQAWAEEEFVHVNPLFENAVQFRRKYKHLEPSIRLHILHAAVCGKGKSKSKGKGKGEGEGEGKVRSPQLMQCAQARERGESQSRGTYRVMILAKDGRF